MPTNVYMKKIYRKLNEDINVVMLKGAQMVNYKKKSALLL